MLRGIYTATSSLLTKTRELNTHSNNIANLSTAGFKSDRLITTTFAEALALRQEQHDKGDLVKIGRSYRGKAAVEIYTDHTQGIFDETMRSLDFAVSGEGFFTMLSRDGGKYYTRNGQFQIDAEGYLVNGLGDYVADGTDSSIFVGRADFIGDNYGNLFASTGDYLGSLGIFVPEDYTALKKNDEQSFVTMQELDAGSTEFQGSVKQGFIEVSNTDVAYEMAAMISNTRSYQSMTQLLRTYDAILAKTISEVGRA